MFLNIRQNEYVAEFDEILDDDGNILKYIQMFWGEVDRDYAERIIEKSKRGEEPWLRKEAVAIKSSALAFTQDQPAKLASRG